MTDARLRAMERRYRETGALEDEAAWLGARVQAGQVTPEALKLAADLKYAAARLAQNKRPVEYLDLKLWTRELFLAWGNEVVVRVSLASARRATQQIARAPIKARIGKGLDAIEAWLRCPCDEHLEGAQGAVVLCRVESSFTLGTLIEETVGAMTLRGDDATLRFSRTVGLQAPYLTADMLATFDLDGTAEVRRAVEREVVPWALGDRL